MSFLTKLFKKSSRREEIGNLFTQFRTWKEWQDVVTRHPELLSEEADELLADLLAAARAERDATAARIFEEHRAVLSRCREVGVVQAFAEKLGETPLPLRLLLGLLDVPPQERRRIAETLTYDKSPAEREEILKRYPVLQETLEKVLEGEPVLIGPEAADTRGRALRAGGDSSGDGRDAALAAWESIVEHPGFATSPETFRTRVLSHAGQAFYDRYKRSGDGMDLNRAISLLEEAARLTPADSPDRPAALHNRCVCYNDRYRRSGDAEDLSRAVELSTEALQLQPSTPAHLAHNLSDLATSLRYRYRRTGESHDLLRAVEAWQEAVRLTPPDSPEQAIMLYNLSIGYRDLYVATGAAADFRKYIDAGRRALQLVPPDAPDRAGFLLLQGVFLRDLYKSAGDLAALDTAVESLRQAARETPPAAPNRDLLLTSLGSALFNRYQRGNNESDLREAVEAWSQAVRATRPDSPERGMMLHNLGNGLRAHGHLTNDAVELEAAAGYLWQALAATPADAPDRAAILNDLANALTARGVHAGALSDIEQAHDLWRQALGITPPNSPLRVTISGNLANLLKARSLLAGDAADVEQAVTCYREVCEKGLDANVGVVPEYSQLWGGWALQRHEWAEAAQAFDYGLRAVEQLFRTQLLRSNKEAWLREAQRLPLDAAYAHARRGDPESAVVALEVGRTRLLSDTLERERRDLERLPGLGRGELYGRYVSASAHVSRLQNPEPRRPDAPDELDPTAGLRAARAELDAAIAEIQRVPGYEDFFRRPSFERIREAVAAPLAHGEPPAAGVYLVAARAGGLALVVHAGGVRSVFLDFNEGDLLNLLIRREDDGSAGGYLAGQLENVKLRQSLTEVLPLVGEKVMRPVVDAVSEVHGDNAPGASALVLIPTGLLSLLPLHAAPFDAGGAGRTLMDEFDTYYEPSALALEHSRATLASLPAEQPRLFGVGNPLPLPAGVDSLTFARVEVEEAARLFADAEAVFESEATREAVEEKLDTAAYLHFSCHGHFDAENPLASCLILGGGERLTLSALLATPRLDATRLAVLSACKTAVTDFRQLPEEAVGLPSGFLQLGAAGVIGSLWAVNDLSTALLMLKFYDYHLRGGAADVGGRTPPARALRRAQLWLRDVTNAELSTLFAQFKQTAPDAPERVRMPYDLARKNFTRHALGAPSGRPFAHPYYWAAFAFYGA